LKALARDLLDTTVRGLIAELTLHLDDLRGLHSASEPKRKQALDQGVCKVVYDFKQAITIVQPVLPLTVAILVLTRLLNAIAAKVTEDLLDLPDIGEDDSQVLFAFCRKLDPLVPMVQALSTNDTKPWTAAMMPEWARLYQVSETLKLNLSAIMLHHRQGFYSRISKKELSELITALFASSSLRQNALHEIQTS